MDKLEQSGIALVPPHLLPNSPRSPHQRVHRRNVRIEPVLNRPAGLREVVAVNRAEVQFHIRGIRVQAYHFAHLGLEVFLVLWYAYDPFNNTVGEG